MSQPNLPRRLVVLGAVVGLAVSACQGSGTGTPTPSGGATSTGTALYLVDSNMGDAALSALPDGTLDGVKGTVPGAPVEADLRNRLLQLDPSLSAVGLSYAPEAYDATVLVALAAAQARSDAGRSIASAMQDVSRDGTACTSFSQCSLLVRQGENIDYQGVSGPVDLDDRGDVTSATVGVYQYQTVDGKAVVPGLNAPGEALAYEQGTAEQAAGTPPPLTATVNAGADGQLTIGGYLPLTGSLAAFGPAEETAVRLAVKEINAAGGVLGRPVRFVPGDSGDAASPQVGAATVSRLLGAGVDAIVGAPSSALAQATSAGVLQISPISPAPGSSTAQDGGLSFSTAPSGAAQGQVLGRLVDSDGHSGLAILAVRGPYGAALANSTAAAFEAAGGTVLTRSSASRAAVFYRPSASSFSSVVSQVKALDPDAIVLVGGQESAKVVEELVRQGIGPNS